LNGLPNGLNEAAFISFSRSCNIERGAVIDGCPDNGQTDGDVHAGLEPENFDRSMALIVVHGDHQVEVAALCAIE
jgi:hypothetical protein